MERNVFAFLAIACVAVIVGKPSLVRAQNKPQEGMWRAWLDSPGGELPFRLEFVSVGPIGWDNWIHNATERRKLTGTVWNGKQIIIMIDDFDASIVAYVSDDGAELNGTWQKRAAESQTAQLPFHALFDDDQRFARSADWKPPKRSIAGRWAVKFESDKYPAVGIFEQQPDGSVTGTFMTATGDYRYLEGDFDGKKLRLSTFDGAHAFLFHANLGDDDALSGEFWSGDSWHEKWTGKRDPQATLRDPFHLNRTVGLIKMSELKFKDLDGTMHALSEPQFQNKLIILDIFGSWCPNCHDAAEYLVKLDRRYHDVGLTIVGLAYELTGDFQHDARQVKRFKKAHHIEFPLLIAGTSDKKKASQTLPFLDKVIAYPTIVVLDSHYLIKAVHTGFSGPATGREYEAFQKKMDDIIGDALLRPKLPWEK